MPSYSFEYLARWSNYHLTQLGQHAAPGYAADDGIVHEIAEIHCADLAGAAGTDMFAAAAATLKDFLKVMTDRLAATSGDLLPKAFPKSCGLMGQGWSFANLVAADDLLLDLDGLTGIAAVASGTLHPDNQLPANRQLMVLGGTRLREIVNWGGMNGRNLTLKTSGTHLGPTIAGAAATASHGSRLGYGGVQNLIRGMHFVTSPTRSIWIEPASQPVLSDTAARKFSDAVVRDDALFADALIHLGSMGIVSGVIVELVPDTHYLHRFAFARPDSDWLARCAAGQFSEIAATLGLASNPVFYEVTLNPLDWQKSEAIHSFYLPAPSPKDFALQSAVQPVSSDFTAKAIALLATHAETSGNDGYLQALDDPADNNRADAGSSAPPPIFALYRSVVDQLVASGKLDPPLRWGELHGDIITGGYPGALWNASFAIDRSRLPDVIPLIGTAVAGFPPTFVFTIRFVSNPAGTLAFTRFPETAVIEIDGISPNAPGGLGHYGQFIIDAAAKLRAALDAADIDYSMHWAKLGTLLADKVAKDFGDVNDPATRAGRWRATRERLLAEPLMRNLFWNEAVVTYGLVDRPLPSASL